MLQQLGLHRRILRIPRDRNDLWWSDRIGFHQVYAHYTSAWPYTLARDLKPTAWPAPEVQNSHAATKNFVALIQLQELRRGARTVPGRLRGAIRRILSRVIGQAAGIDKTPTRANRSGTAGRIAEIRAHLRRFLLPAPAPWGSITGARCP